VSYEDRKKTYLARSLFARELFTEFDADLFDWVLRAIAAELVVQVLLQSDKKFRKPEFVVVPREAQYGPQVSILLLTENGPEVPRNITDSFTRAYDQFRQAALVFAERIDSDALKALDENVQPIYLTALGLQPKSPVSEFSTDSSQILSLLWLTQPAVIHARKPEMIRLASPSPSIAVFGFPPGGQQSSVGIFCRDSDGVPGVTACHHATGPVGTPIMIGGCATHIAMADQVQDIVFAPLPDGYVIPSLVRGAGGFRNHPPPYQTEPAQFDGQTSGPKATVVQAHSPGILWRNPLSQEKVYTTPDVSLGDSGSALIDNNNQVLGFAFQRTQFGAPIQFAEWIWADNAIATLGLQPL
jgi:hypothetical protein